MYFFWKFQIDPKALKKYIEKSPKVFIWRKMFRVEKTIELSHKIFLPIALIIGIVAIGVGLYFMFI